MRRNTGMYADTFRELTLRLCVLLLMGLLGSCTDFWSGSTKRRFHEACTEEAIKWAGSTQRADSYCECVLQKMMQKYPNEEDAFAHMGELAQDTDLISCREVIK